MTYTIELHGKKADVTLRPLPDGRFGVSVDGGPERIVSARALGAAEWMLADERGARRVAVHVSGDHVAAQIAGHGVSGTIVDPRALGAQGDDGAAAGTVRSPMPGAVARILVNVGDAVSRGQVLVVVEAMKMENEFRAPIDGVVTEVGVRAGSTIEAGALLVTVSPPA